MTGAELTNTPDNKEAVFKKMKRVVKSIVFGLKDRKNNRKRMNREHLVPCCCFLHLFGSLTAGCRGLRVWVGMDGCAG